MPHAHTVSLIEQWRRSRSPGRALPERTALSPLLFGPLTPQMFVLAEDADGWRFRTAGGLLDDLHGRALTGEPFLGLWAADDHAAVRRALDDARRRGRPWVGACRGETPRGRTALVELTLAPVLGPLGEPDRCLGLHQPLSPLARLRGEALGPLRLCAPAGPDGGPRLVVDNTRPGPLGSSPGADVAERYTQRT